MAASSSSSSEGSFNYDVFINFRGEDTRRSFVCHLYHALKQTALETFIDSEELQKGDDLSKIYEAIQDSRLSILVFSKHYANSTWCLKELVQILECMDRQNQIVVPIFYGVDPSHVRKRKESFAEAFAKHESDSNLDKEELVSCWKSSLTRATNLSGYDSKNYRDDFELIKSIVEDVIKKLDRISPIKTDGLIGMDTHMDKIDSLLQLGVDDRRIVGICGMGGTGKSTIARAVYENISPQFEHKCFLDNVKEGFTKRGARQMVEDLLCATLNLKDGRTLVGGVNMMRQRLGKKKVLLVLDDVDAMDQIDILIGENPSNSFGGGSRIIITTRDNKLLAVLVSKKKSLAVFKIYKPKFTTEKALELFRRHAFRTIKFSKSYGAISKRFVNYAHSLPLALKVLGALLVNKTVEEWESEWQKLKAMKKLKNMSNTVPKIGPVLRASYNGLEEWQKNIFLDIACFFKGKQKEDVTQFHKSCDFPPENGLRALEERSLVTVSHCGGLEMHDLIQEMGRDIVYRESTEDPGRRSRLWYYKDVLQVLAPRKPTKAVEGIILDLSKLKKLRVKDEAFVGMERLKLLQLTYERRIACKQKVSGDLSLSNELKVLVWHGYPLKSLPYDFQPTNLIKIDMRHSHLERLWEGTKPLPNLERMDLSHSKYLIKTPDLTEATNLKYLNLEGTAIKELPSSIDSLTGLRYLIMRNCTSLVSLPDEICNLEFLENLDLTGCSKLSKLPDNFKNWKCLGEYSFYNLTGSGIKQLPFCISEVKSLICIGCKELTAPFSSWTTCMRNPSSSILVSLDLSDCNVLELSDGIAHLSALRYLDLSGNNNLEGLPEAMNRLGQLEKIYLKGCKGLKSIPELCSSIQHIDANNCTSLETVSTPQLPCVGSIHLTFFNCLKLAKTNLFMDIVETAATDNQGEDSGSDSVCDSDSDSYTDNDPEFKPLHRMCLPGSDIPDWFNHQDRGSSVTVQLPPGWSPDLCEGLAICAISNLRGADNRETLESAFCCATFKANEGQDNFYFRLQPPNKRGTDVPLESDHMILGYINLSNFGTLHSGRKYTQATFRIVTWNFMSITWKDCTWITSCGVQEIKRETRERGKEKMVEVQEEEEECSGGPRCFCFLLSGCTIS